MKCLASSFFINVVLNEELKKSFIKTNLHEYSTINNKEKYSH